MHGTPAAAVLTVKPGRCVPAADRERLVSAAVFMVLEVARATGATKISAH